MNKMNTLKFDFYVLAKSNNTNSFGLYQMIVVSKSGEAYKTHASYLSAKDVGELIYQTVETNDSGVIKHKYFQGHEITTKLPQVPKDVLNEFFSTLNV